MIVNVNKDSLKYVSGLNFKDKIEKMSETQFNAYIQSLNKFIDDFTLSETKLKAALSAKVSVPAMAINISNIAKSLDKIYAEELAKQAHAVSTDASKLSRIDLEARVENMLLGVSSLSIDIQMALRRGSTGGTGSTGTAPAAPAAPVKPVVSAPAAPSVSSIQNMPQTSGGRPMILAVDNAIMFLNTLRKLLQDTSYDLHCMTSGDDALEFIKTRRPALFLLDIEMPGMDGYALARRIIDSGHRAPIIFITANSAREYVDRAFEAGGSALLMKPLRLNQLLEKIREFL